MSAPQKGTARCSAFTLVELAAILAMVTLLLLVLLPAKAGTKARSFRCLDNSRQVMTAVAMYSHDNHDLLPPNPDDGGTQLGSQLGYYWCTGMAGMRQADEFNPDLLADPARCLLAPYLTTNVTVFRCTEDTRTGKYDGGRLYPNSPLIGKVVPAARTISLSQAVGTIDAGYASGGTHSGIPNLPVNGSWLTGSHGANNAKTGPYRTYGKTSQMVIPAPAQLITFIEEAPYSLNDGGLAASANPSAPIWIDFPSALHLNACVVSFADGHAEFHKWVGQGLNVSTLPGTQAGANNPDWLWLAQHISARF